jgi:outer membrane protein assembly factor BamA
LIGVHGTVLAAPVINMRRSPALLLLLIVLNGGSAAAQATTPAPDAGEMDVFDLVRKLRNKEPAPDAASWDYTEAMKAFAPVIGFKPSSGAMFGVAGNIAFYRGDPATTHISSMVASLTVSTRKQIAITDRIALFTRHDRIRLDADHRFQWTSLETNALGTSAETEDSIQTGFDFFRLHHTAYYRLRPSLFAGGGLYFDTHTSAGPHDDDDAVAWQDSAYVQYSDANGLPIESQASAGASVDLMWDSRDSFINAQHGSFARIGYRKLFDGFLGGDSSWQRVSLDMRTYRRVTASGRHKIAAWLWADLVVDGIAPYFDLPATGQDTYGRSARGYREGQFRGERLAYGEIEYRGTLTRNGLLGMVVFVNTTTASNLQGGERLFDSFATGAGAGLRLSINKRSKTNLCFDVGFGKQGSRGVYLAIQEAF